MGQALAAAVFAVHPLRVESVAWVVERKDVLSGLFFVLTLAAYLRLARRGFSLLRYLVVLACFSLGLLAKSTLVPLPLLLLLLDYWPLGRFATRSGARLVCEKLPLAALSIAFCLATISSTKSSQRAYDPLGERFDVVWRMENVPLSYVGYLGTFFGPAGLALPYPRPGPELPLGRVWAAVLLLAAVTVATLAVWRKQPYLSVGWLWYLVMLAPMSGLLAFDMHARAMTADRFTYLPQIGLGIALIWGLADALRSLPARRWVGSVAAVLALALLAAAAWRQTSFWRNNETLWRRAIACTSPNKMARHALGNALMDRAARARASWNATKRHLDSRGDRAIPGR